MRYAVLVNRRTIMKTWIGIAMASLLCSASAQAVDGPALYREHCAKCHGDTGRADSWRGYLYFARDFSSPRWQAANSDADILAEIDRGPRIMPAYRDTLTLEERQALVREIRRLGGK
jgi:mono/diheme cytochrome c family protein